MKKTMKTLFLTILSAAIAFTYACNSGETKNDTPHNKSETAFLDNTISASDKDFDTDWKTLTKDFNTWYNYTYYNVRLSNNFIGLDLDSTVIDKPAFLNKLITSDVVAFKIKETQGRPVYKLYQLNSNDENISITSKQMAVTENEHLKMEGVKMPQFSFTDLNGKVYDNASTKGKILVLKCWFIHCVACVKEFPDLNDLVDSYKDRHDILFVSLAIDPKQNLKNFLKTKEFKYAVVPEMENFMSDQLHITAYPTHILIGKDGKIIKVVNRIEDLTPFLSREDKKT